MSVWTHVAAVFRIDYVKLEYVRRGTINGRRSVEWDKVVGRTIYEPPDLLTVDSYENRREREDWEDYHVDPSAFVPTGSEGSLQRLIWVNQNTSCAAQYTVTVFGDLRDYEDVDAVREWFDRVCDRCGIRQAVCDVEVSGVGTWTWSRRWGDE